MEMIKPSSSNKEIMSVVKFIIYNLKRVYSCFVTEEGFKVNIVCILLTILKVKLC